MAELIPDPAARRHFTAGCPPLPLAMFEEVHPAAPRGPDAPAAYLQLSEAYHSTPTPKRKIRKQVPVKSAWPPADQSWRSIRRRVWIAFLPHCVINPARWLTSNNGR
jgi:hypothetical protein